MDKKGASLLRANPSTATAYTIIGIGERHTGQACVLRSLDAAGIADPERADQWYNDHGKTFQNAKVTPCAGRLASLDENGAIVVVEG
jgi:hypothetical protein